MRLLPMILAIVFTDDFKEWYLFPDLCFKRADSRTHSSIEINFLFFSIKLIFTGWRL